VSNAYRILMQAYITRTLYHGEDSLGAQAQRAAVETKKLKDEHGAPQVMPRIGKRKDGADTGTTKAKPAPTPPAAAATNGSSKATSGSGANGAGPTPPRPRTGASNRSKKKRKRR
jgi:hypothetical protein